uniref:Uncharacterized protein n=1 Tax=Arundo donax TaxID=35708 RepID=A0A0A9CDT8_ARUDO
MLPPAPTNQVPLSIAQSNPRNAAFRIGDAHRQRRENQV